MDGPRPEPAAARAQVADALRTKDLDQAPVHAALASLSIDIAVAAQRHGTVRQVPAAAAPNLRNDMF